MKIDLHGILKGVAGLGIPGLSQAAGLAASAFGSDALANLTPEQQQAYEAEMNRHEEAMQAGDVEAFKTAVSEAIAEIQSPDKYVSRARPTQLYAFIAFNMMLGVAILFLGYHPDTIQLEAVGFAEGALGGNAAWYAKLRSDDKKIGKQA